jgi:hypothetical protein
MISLYEHPHMLCTHFELNRIIMSSPNFFFERRMFRTVIAEKNENTIMSSIFFPLFLARAFEIIKRRIFLYAVSHYNLRNIVQIFTTFYLEEAH